jgi:hypothetical protein
VPVTLVAVSVTVPVVRVIVAVVDVAVLVVLVAVVLVAVVVDVLGIHTSHEILHLDWRLANEQSAASCFSLRDKHVLGSLTPLQ